MAKINTDEFIVVVIEENGRSVQYSTESILFYHNHSCAKILLISIEMCSIKTGRNPARAPPRRVSIYLILTRYKYNLLNTDTCTFVLQ